MPPGGDPGFRQSFDRLLQQAVGKAIPLAPIPLTSRLYNGSIPDSVNATRAEYRWYYRFKVGSRSTPRLSGVEMNGRYAVIFSEEDITSGLLGTNTWGILGYATDTAQALARNMLLYAKDPKAGKDGNAEDAGIGRNAQGRNTQVVHIGRRHWGDDDKPRPALRQLAQRGIFHRKRLMMGRGSKPLTYAATTAAAMATILACAVGTDPARAQTTTRSAPATTTRPAASQPATTTARPVVKRPTPAAPELTDAEVLEAMRKGAHYLLDELKTRETNWETKFDDKGHVQGAAWPGGNFGGETSLVLYALLHVGQSVQEDTDLGPRLRFNSKELEPVVTWLCSIRPAGTYTAGLYSSALGLVPKETEAGKLVQAALRHGFGYITTSMDEDGGYTYTGIRVATRTDPQGGPLEAWDDYVESRSKKDKAAADKALGGLRSCARQARSKFGGGRGNDPADRHRDPHPGHRSARQEGHRCAAAGVHGSPGIADDHRGFDQERRQCSAGWHQEAAGCRAEAAQ